jgi:hypothetical protein
MHSIKAFVGALQKAVESHFPAHDGDLNATLEATIYNSDWWRSRGPALARASSALFVKIVVQLSIHRSLEVI